MKNLLSKLPFKNFKMSKRMVGCFAVIVGVIVIPLMYSYFYLGAFWDPYSTLEMLPVAVVNNDLGATIDGEERNLGNDVCEKLKEDGSLKFVFTDYEEAKEGTAGDEYYAMIEIPEDFSKNISSANSKSKEPATIIYSPNQKRNYLASQILNSAITKIEESTRASINSEITQQLVDKFNEVPGQMEKLNDGSKKLSEGSEKILEGTEDLKTGTEKLSTGAGTLAEGTATYSEKFKEFQTGLTSAKNGGNELSTGIGKLATGMGDLQSGSTKLKDASAKLGDLTNGAKALDDGANSLNNGVIAYTAGVDALIKNTMDTSAYMSALVTAHPELMQDASFSAFISKMSDPANATAIQTLQAAGGQVKAGSAQVKAGADAIAAGTANLPQLTAGITQLSAGVDTAKAGVDKLNSGSQSLYSGLVQLEDASVKLGDASGSIASGAAQLNTGAAQLDDGAGALNEGASELSEGTKTLQSGVETSIKDTKNELPKLDGLAEFTEAPVTVSEEDITEVPNYGTAFGPYFLSLSLWVGGLIIFVAIYYDPSNKFKILSNQSEHKLARSFIYLFIGFIQAIVLGIVLKYGLGLEVANTKLYFMSCCLVSLVFIAMIQFFMVFLKDFGKFISMLLLILQLTSCGGTFPMETVPKFFQVIYPFMPMTYSVGLFKQTISGIDEGQFMYNTGILVALFVVFMILTVIGSVIKSKRSEQVIKEYKEPEYV